VDGVLRTAAEVMLTTPASHPLSATVGEIRHFFRDDHVHAALVVSPAGYLEAVVERDDIAGYQAAWPKNAKGHSTVNAVNPFVFADLGNAPTFSDTRVEIEPAEPTAT
jgi:hypothetical protein